MKNVYTFDDLTISTTEGDRILSGFNVLTCRDVARKILGNCPHKWVVYAWGDAPNILKQLCHHRNVVSGWMAITQVTPCADPPSWISRLDAHNEPDLYLLKGVSIYVGSL
jgi:hypothetical protein